MKNSALFCRQENRSSHLYVYVIHIFKTFSFFKRKAIKIHVLQMLPYHLSLSPLLGAPSQPPTAPLPPPFLYPRPSPSSWVLSPARVVLSNQQTGTFSPKGRSPPFSLPRRERPSLGGPANVSRHLTRRRRRGKTARGPVRQTS